jgi:hypothetical protein
VERFFAELTEKRLRRQVFRSILHLIEAIEACLEQNRQPKPFIWTKIAGQVFEKLDPFMQSNYIVNHSTGTGLLMHQGPL